MRTLVCECRDGIMFLHRPGMGKPNLGEPAGEPHSVLLDGVRFYRDIGEKALFGSELIHLARGRGAGGECPEPKISYDFPAYNPQQ